MAQALPYKSRDRWQDNSRVYSLHYRLYLRSPLLTRKRVRCNFRRSMAFNRAVLLDFLVGFFMTEFLDGGKNFWCQSPARNVSRWPCLRFGLYTPGQTPQGLFLPLNATPGDFQLRRIMFC
jgi:hypothetical protein